MAEDITFARLIQRIRRTDTIESFRFTVDKRINFIPGQFLQIIFDESDTKNKSLNKYLSFSSSPQKDYIEVTKKLSDSEFSQKLKSLKSGSKIALKGPYGNCVFKEEYKKIGFLVGGIGITPVISIMECIVDKNLDTDIILLYSNRTESIAFEKELDHWRSLNSNIKIFYIITDCKPKDAKCISGSIDRDLLLEKDKYWCDRLLFIFGPPNMVGAMQDLCLEVGCDKQLLKVERFTGY